MTFDAKMFIPWQEEYECIAIVYTCFELLWLNHMCWNHDKQVDIFEIVIIIRRQ